MIERARHRRGLALGTILLCLAVAVALLFLAVSASLSHLNVVKSASQREHAQNLAESAIAKAIERALETDFQFGRQPTDRVQVSFDGLSDAEGIVTFVQSEFSGAYSTSNLGTDVSVVGAGGTTVPRDALHLIGRGRVGGVERWVECIYHKPPYPDGLVASGGVQASGLILSGVRKGEDYQGGNPSEIPPEQRVLANLFSNATSGPGGRAVVLGPGCDINGTVGTPGQIEIDPSCQIAGEVLPRSDQRPLPSLSIPERIAVLEPNAVDVASTGGDLQLSDNWFNQAIGGLNVGGDLHLNGSALTVQGPLTVRGAIRGMGILLVNGPVRILDGGSTVESTDQVALAATGDVELAASGPEGNYFQGLVYTEGDLVARDITVVGTVVVNGKNGKRGEATLDNVRMVRAPASVNIHLQSVKGEDFPGRTASLSFTLRPAPDGETYLCDARFYITQESDIPPHLFDSPLLWPTVTSDNITEKAWNDVNVGRPGPNFGRDLGFEIGTFAGEWAGKKNKWRRRYSERVPDQLNALLQQTDPSYNVSFSLNNLLAEDFGESRILVWRQFEPSGP